MPRLLLAALLVLTACVKGGAPSDGVRRPGPVETLLSGKQPISTSFRDVHDQVPALDRFDPQRPRDMTTQAKRNGRAFVLGPGLWELDGVSYCLKGGVPARVEGNGFVLAPLAGPQADIIQSLLIATEARPDLARQDIQELIWAIIARISLSEMSGPKQALAASLLTPAQLFRLNDGAVGLVPKATLEKAISGLPEPVRMAMRLEADLRAALTRADATFEEIEAIAVPAGVVTPDVPVPAGRWARHPGGFYVRLYSERYSQTRQQIYVPEPVTTTRDALGRITRIEGPGTDLIALDYDDGIAPLELPEAPGLRGYAFSRIRLSRDGEEEVWEDVGWTWVEAPAAAGRKLEPRPSPSLLRQVDDRRPRGRDRFDDWRERELRRGVDELGDFDRARDGIETATQGTRQDKAKWLTEHTSNVQKAWAWASCMLRGDCDSEPSWDPTEETGVPATNGVQRRALTGRGRR